MVNDQILGRLPRRSFAVTLPESDFQITPMARGEHAKNKGHILLNAAFYGRVVELLRNKSAVKHALLPLQNICSLIGEHDQCLILVNLCASNFF